VPRPLTREAVGVKRRYLVRPVQPPRSAFAGFRFPHEVILTAVRWYLRYGLSFRDLEELLAERGIEVDHVNPVFDGSSGSRRWAEARWLHIRTILSSR
jgi:transposase-like protein